STLWQGGSGAREGGGLGMPARAVVLPEMEPGRSRHHLRDSRHAQSGARRRQPRGRCRLPAGRGDAPQDVPALHLAVAGRRRTMGKALSQSGIEQYARDGYYFPVQVLTTDEARRYRERLERAERALGGPLRRVYRIQPRLLFAWPADLVRLPTILDAVEDVIGPDILCWNTSFFTKEEKSPGFVSWHQDATYWGLSEPNVVTAWVAFTDSVPANGNMRVIPASHRAPLTHADTFHPDNLLSRGQEITVEVDEAQAVDITLRAGEMSLHHVLLVHGSGANPTEDRRIGFAIRYIPTCVRQTAGPRDSATLVRGQDLFGHFEPEPRPEADLDPAMLQLHAEISDRQATILYRGTARTAF